MPKARENVGNQVVIGFSFASDWLRQWREFFWVNHRATERSKAEPMQSRMTFVRSKLVKHRLLVTRWEAKDFVF